ncbi:MAG: hypothetical protein NT075_11580 [Chloroflexi bacterium]|nr:hypothetical protein [Chloroflexota bacterium]
MATKKLISREEALGGMAGRATKQASTLLTLIENRTTHCVSQARQVGNYALTIAATQTPRRAFLEALAQQREASDRPTIQEIEQFAAQWAVLVPENPTIRATVAYQLSQNYAMPYATTPGIRAALGLETAAVQQAYQRLRGQPLTQLYTAESRPFERWRWAWTAFSKRVETLPPFWITFFLTMPGASGLLALPMALARVGTGWGLAIIVLFGVVNMLSAAALAETVVRSGTARFGLGFLGQLAQEYLGSEASALLTVAMAANNFLVLIIFFLGVSGTLAGATGVPATLWMLPLFAVTIYFLSRRSLNATVTTTLVIGFTNLLILLAIPLLALPHFQIQYLASGDSGQSFTPAALGLIVGILSSTFLSHFLVATYGPVVLPRDPSGRAWIQGSMAAVFALMLLACLWLLIVNGVLSTQILTSATGTVLTPLAVIVGPAVNVLGSMLVILSLGLTTIQVALGQYYLIEERLPRRGAHSWLGQLSENQRFILAISPMLAILAISEWLAISGTGSFSTLLSILGVLALPLLTGILPVLLLIATRRKGDFSPGFVARWLGHPVTLSLLYLFFISSILIHGLYIWESLTLRLLALVSGLVILVVTGMIWRRGLLASRTVIELRQDERLKGLSQWNVVSNGQPLLANVRLDNGNQQTSYYSTSEPISHFARLQTAVFQWPATSATQLKLWAHRLTPEGNSEGLPVQLVLQDGAQEEIFAPVQTNGPVILPLSGGAGQVVVQLAQHK